VSGGEAATVRTRQMRQLPLVEDAMGWPAWAAAGCAAAYHSGADGWRGFHGPPGSGGIGSLRFGLGGGRLAAAGGSARGDCRAAGGQGSGPGVPLLSELARRAKDAGRLRPEFVLDDLLTVGFAYR
jgi:hypothetical protein